MKSYFNSQALIFPLTLYVEIELLQNSLFKFYSASTFPLTFDIFGCNCHGNWVPARYVYRWPHICSGSIETSTISRSLKVQLRACISGVMSWSYKFKLVIQVTKSQYLNSLNRSGHGKRCLAHFVLIFEAILCNRKANCRGINVF